LSGPVDAVFPTAWDFRLVSCPIIYMFRIQVSIIS
jgi:hypothetical protein